MAEWLNRRQSGQVNGTGYTSLFLPPAVPSESDPVRVSSLLPTHSALKEWPFIGQLFPYSVSFDFTLLPTGSLSHYFSQLFCLRK
jgi:hypothetical protein